MLNLNLMLSTFLNTRHKETVALCLHKANAEKYAILKKEKKKKNFKRFKSFYMLTLNKKQCKSCYFWHNLLMQTLIKFLWEATYVKHFVFFPSNVALILQEVHKSAMMNALKMGECKSTS